MPHAPAAARQRGSELFQCQTFRCSTRAHVAATPPDVKPHVGLRSQARTSGSSFHELHLENWTREKTASSKVWPLHQNDMKRFVGPSLHGLRETLSPSSTHLIQ